MDRRSVACLMIVAASGVCSSRSSANEASAGLFARGDTDRTTVISPRAAASVRWNDGESGAGAAYSADIWTSASIDVRTAATMPVTEQRDQLDADLFHTLDDVVLGGGVYVSTENDYEAYGANLRSTQELAGGSATLEERVSVGHDLVGRSGDPQFEEALTSVGGRLVLTQIVDPETIIQGAVEITHREGYQSNPYRFVGMGGDGQCAGTGTLCLPEAHPTLRTRNAFVLRARRALSADSSVGLGYRFYLDDWGVSSHTGVAQVSWLPKAESVLTLRYRFYLQSAAGFYRSTYPMASGEVRYVTRDRELSPMFSNRVALSYAHRAMLDGEGASLSVGLAVGGTVFVYRDFVGLDDVYAIDGSVALTLEL